MTLTLSRSPSIAAGGAGARPVKIGKRVYSFPSGLHFSHGLKGGTKVLWVFDPQGGTVYCFTEGGEVKGIPAALLAAVREKIFGVQAEKNSDP